MEGRGDLAALVGHSDHGSQHTSLRYGQRLADAGIAASTGTVGDSHDNALAETINGLYKTELVKPRKPWKTIAQVELATAEWVAWYNHCRLYQHCCDMPPVEYENPYYTINNNALLSVGTPQ